MRAHWTGQSNKKFLFQIVDNFIIQLENKMEAARIPQSRLAQKLGISKGRVSQMFSRPENISLRTILKFARGLDMKVALVAYEDNDPKNIKGPINPEVFLKCWEDCDKPRNFWEIKRTQTTRIQPSIPLSTLDQCWDSPYPCAGGVLPSADIVSASVESKYGSIGTIEESY